MMKTSKEHLERLREIHDEAKTDGLAVRYWADGVLVLCTPEFAPPADQGQLDLIAGEEVPAPD